MPARASVLSDLLAPRIDRAAYQAAMEADPAAGFYAARGWEPYWVSSKDRTKQLIAMLGESWRHGLNPENYHTGDFQSALDKGDWKMPQMELRLTAQFVHYMRDLTGARVRPEQVGMGKNNWVLPLGDAQVYALMAQEDWKKIAADYAPRGQTYQHMQETLAELLAAAPPPYEKILPIRLAGKLKPGERNPRVPDLRLRLKVRQLSDDPDLYDDALFAALTQFQESHGLYADGVVGPATLDALNRGRQERIAQLIVNMERLRWVEGPRPPRFVIVNIPSETLWAVDHGSIALEMPVIVGRIKRETPSFIANITGVRLNPNWTVPPTIKNEDIVPKLQENPDYLTDKGMQLVTRVNGQTQVIDPRSVDWATVTARDLAQLHMVQTPGAHNPLGQMRVLMPNPYSVYLHDTNERGYFDRQSRALSSGCIRVKEPDKLAEFILAPDGWTEDKIADVIAKTKTRDIMLAQPIPVYILYYTAWVDDRGRVVFGSDIYDYDQIIAARLKAIDGIPVSTHTAPQS